MARKLRVAINGFGRIGRNVLRAILDRASDEIEVVAINDLAVPGEAIVLFEHDSVFGRFRGDIVFEYSTILFRMPRGREEVLAEQRVRFVSEPDPEKLPWKEFDVDVVLECTGRFVDLESATAHIRAGAKRVIVSAPAKGAPLLVYGVNHLGYAGEIVVSNASCTTNCAAPVARVILEAFGIRHANLLTVHAATAGQNVVDGTPPGRKGGDLRLARASLGNMIPTKTGAAKSVGLVLPELNGKFDGIAMRVPTLDVSFCHLTFEVERATTRDEVVAAMLRAAEGPSYCGVLELSSAPIVSSDLVGNRHSAVVDVPFTQVIDGTQVIVDAWYDNEGAYSSRMVDMATKVVGPMIER